MILLKHGLLSVSECVYTAERFVIVRVANILFINVYLPCAGTADRELICSELLAEIVAWRSKYPECGCIVGGDFNTDLDVQCPMSCNINKFMVENNLLRCDVLFPCNVAYTYSNEQLKHYSKIDYLTCDSVHVTKFDIIDSNTNLSDHLPIVIELMCSSELSRDSQSARDKQSVVYLRWDHADTVGYFNATRLQLQSIFEEIHLIEAYDTEGYGAPNSAQTAIESVYEKLVFALQSSASKFVPSHKANFYKFWWSQELDCLKEKAIDSDKIWKANGRPRSGPIYSKRSADKRAYKVAIRKSQREADDAYSNDLHDALISKRGNEFWKCWNSKFARSSSRSRRQVDGLTDHQQIASVALLVARYLHCRASMLTCGPIILGQLTLKINCLTLNLLKL